MTYCAKCGAEVDKEMAFCPKCGAPLKAAEPGASTDLRRERREKAIDEKEEKHERTEKAEKHEKQESPVSQLVGGSILVLIGLLLYLETIGYGVGKYIGPLILIIIGLAIVLGPLKEMVRKRNPPT